MSNFLNSLSVHCSMNRRGWINTLFFNQASLSIYLQNGSNYKKMEYAIFPIATLVASIVYANTIGKNKVFGDKARKERSMCIYNLVPVRAPALTGFLLKAFVTILKVPILGRFVLNILMYQNQLYKVRE